MRRTPGLSECELTTMKCIWDAKEPVTCHEVIEKLRNDYGMEYKDTTVYTFLKKLKDKGFVDSYRKGVTYYRPICDEQEYRNEQLRKEKKFWFGGSASEMVSALFQAEPIDEEEREKLKRMIDELGRFDG